MNDRTREIINMLHEPLDEKDKTKVTVSRRYANIDGETQWKNEEEYVFSQRAYARRLHKAFGYGWNSKEEEVDLWGISYCRCTIEAQLPDGDVVIRSGLTSDFQSFSEACEMFGIGGTDGAVLHVARKLNVMFGFDWGTSTRVLNEGFVCLNYIETSWKPICRTRSNRQNRSTSIKKRIQYVWNLKWDPKTGPQVKVHIRRNPPYLWRGGSMAKRRRKQSWELRSVF